MSTRNLIYLFPTFAFEKEILSEIPQIIKKNNELGKMKIK